MLTTKPARRSRGSAAVPCLGFRVAVQMVKNPPAMLDPGWEDPLEEEVGTQLEQALAPCLLPVKTGARGGTCSSRGEE